ncbi:MAG: class I SAM-dependent methyltransferase [Defluviitaleaceae bacterium]|nr:class I SAM-dependent methyltransferase [Defluviitaleaceae bacterium]
MEKTVHEKNYEQWDIVAENYHEIRPATPEIITKIILSWLNKCPDIVVDVGCGTGLSTTVWKDIAAKVIGVEPNDKMRAIATSNSKADNVAFVNGLSNETNLPSDYADIITIAQAFHWMDIDSTLHEVYRMLKSGGIFAIYDYAIPSIVGWEIEKAFAELRVKCSKIWYSQIAPPIHNDKKSYDDRVKAFGKFRYSKEVVCHGIEKWPLQKAIAFLVHASNADFAVKIDSGVKRDIDEFIALVEGKYSGELEIIFPYTMVMGVK